MTKTFHSVDDIVKYFGMFIKVQVNESKTEITMFPYRTNEIILNVSKMPVAIEFGAYVEGYGSEIIKKIRDVSLVAPDPVQVKSRYFVAFTIPPVGYDIQNFKYTIKMMIPDGSFPSPVTFGHGRDRIVTGITELSEADYNNFVADKEIFVK